MEFQVRKGLETPLKVHGMNTRFFLVYCGVFDKCHERRRFFRDVYSCFDGGRTCFCLLTCAVYQSFH